MNKCFFLLFFFLSSQLCADTHDVKGYLTSENDSLSIIEGTVNAYNGKLVQKNVDIQILGEHPLELNRYYDGGHHFNGDAGYGWGYSYPLLLSFDGTKTSKNVYLEQRAGFGIPCTVKTITRKGEQFYCQGGVDEKFFRSGYTNCCEALLNGEPSLRSLKMQGTQHTFIVILGDGTRRCYSFFTTRGEEDLYRLVREEFPDRSQRHYSYTYNLNLERIWTTNSSGSLTFNWINFVYQADHVDVSASNGQFVRYSKKPETGTAKRTGFGSHSSVSFSENILKKVSGNSMPECRYDVLTRTHFQKTLFSTKEIAYPDGRVIQADYDSHERVKQLWKSGIGMPSYTFNYHTGHVVVTDAKGEEKHFYYNNRHLVQVAEKDQIKHFIWDRNGQLTRQVLADKHNHTIVERLYQYDENGNVVEAKINGSICQKGSKEDYIVRYTYNEFNQPLTENYNHTKEITYTYIPGTTLLSRKLTYADNTFVEREFYEYDANGILIKKIVDDGGQPEIDNFTNVSYRLITEIEPQLNPDKAGMTFPRVVKEFYLDLKTGEKHLLKMVENIYSYGDLLSEEKIYDANGNYCYSRHFEYDKRRLSLKSDTLGHRNTYQYDENGNRIFKDKGGSHKTRYVYDAANRLIQKIEEHPHGTFSETYAYDAVGNRISATDRFNQTTRFNYDSLGREISNTDPCGQSEHKEYDVQGHITKSIDKDGYITETTPNFFGKPLEIVYPDGSRKRFKYNLEGHLVQEWERDGQFKTYEVDYLGRARVTKTYSPDGTFLKETKAVYKGPNLIKEVDAKGIETNYSYDGASRLIEKSQGDQITRYEYDQFSRLCKTITPDSVEVKRFDLLHRLSEERIEDSFGIIYKKITYDYDINDNCVLKKVYKDANTYFETNTSFDTECNPLVITDALGAETRMVYHYNNRLEKETFDALGRKTLDIFDPLNRLIFTRTLAADGEYLLSESTFSYDGRNNQTLACYRNLFESHHSSNYEVQTTYNALSEKTSETEAGEKTTYLNYHHGRLHQIIKQDGVILTHHYDALGRLQELISSDGTIHYRYTYDLNDNLLKSGSSQK